ncbi:hypothetical protein BC832DRAFT_619768 [Gaertneriomyces semiglobifer]|nr:hypothetical protein BC832DRAFT_619768 [Gaertneriomyces semiglobifer]
MDVFQQWGRCGTSHQRFSEEDEAACFGRKNQADGFVEALNDANDNDCYQSFTCTSVSSFTPSVNGDENLSEDVDTIGKFKTWQDSLETLNDDTYADELEPFDNHYDPGSQLALNGQKCPPILTKTDDRWIRSIGKDVAATVDLARMNIPAKKQASTLLWWGRLQERCHVDEVDCTLLKKFTSEIEKLELSKSSSDILDDMELLRFKDSKANRLRRIFERYPEGLSEVIFPAGKTMDECLSMVMKKFYPESRIPATSTRTTNPKGQKCDLRLTLAETESYLEGLIYLRNCATEGFHHPVGQSVIAIRLTSLRDIIYSFGVKNHGVESELFGALTLFKLHALDYSMYLYGVRWQCRGFYWLGSLKRIALLRQKSHLPMLSDTLHSLIRLKASLTSLSKMVDAVSRGKANLWQNVRSDRRHTMTTSNLAKEFPYADARKGGCIRASKKRKADAQE